MASFISAAVSAISASSIGGAIVRIIVAYGISRLINGATGADNQQQQVDQGVRLQLSPNTTNPIPLLYGSAYYSGNITDAQLTNNNQTMWVAMTLSEHTTATSTLGTSDPGDSTAVDTSIEEIYYNDQLITFKADGITVDYATNSDGSVDTSARDLVQIYLYKNGSDNPTLPFDYLGGTLPAAAYTLMPDWTSEHTMTNLTFALVKIDYNRDKGVTGIPNIKFKVSNTLYRPGDALYDYMTNTVSGAGLTADQIDTASLIALNDYAVEAVTIFNEDTNETEVLADRYQINGVINPQQAVLDNMQEIANSSGVFIRYDITTGKWGVKINRDDAAAHHFNDSNIISGIDVTATSLDNQYNAIEMQFPNRFIQDQADTIRINLPPEFLNANEPENVLTVQLSMLNEAAQARSLAYLELYQNRYDRVVTFTTDYTKLQVEAGDVITLTNSIYGFDNQTLRVVRVREVEAEDGALAVEIIAQEYDATLYTAGGQPRRPRTPTTPATLPSLGVIATPVAPLFTSANNNRQPSIALSGVVPTGVVDRFEFWYSTDDFATSVLIHEEKNANGAPFNSGTTIVTRVATLGAATYKFKVRAGNEASYSDYSPATAAFEWLPVQTTDEVTDETTFSMIDELLPALGMGALAYLAYKTLYPQLLDALSTTELGKLLGIESQADILAAQEALEQASQAFRFVNVGPVSLGAVLDQSLTLVAGAGITIEADDITHEITFTATGGAGSQINDLSDVTITTPTSGQILAYDDAALAWKNVPITAGTGITVTADGVAGINISATGEADATNAFSEIISGGSNLLAGVTDGVLSLNAGTGIEIDLDPITNVITLTNLCCEDGALSPEVIQDFGKVNVTLLDDCQKTKVWPTKKDIATVPGVPGEPQSWLPITGSGSWYDNCYQQAIETIIISDPDDLLDMKVDDIKTLAGVQTPTTTGQIDYSVGYLQDKTIQIRKVAANEYVAIKNWDSATGDALPLAGDQCLIDAPWSRPLFSSIDYPNGYELATFANLTPVLAAAGSNLKFIYVAEVLAILASTRADSYPGKTEITRNARSCVKTLEVTTSLIRTEFKGVISDDLLWTDEELPIGTVVKGTYTSSAYDPIDDTILDETVIVEIVATGRYRLNKQYKLLDDTTDDARTKMYYYKTIKKIVPASEVASEDGGVVVAV